MKNKSALFAVLARGSVAVHGYAEGGSATAMTTATVAEVPSASQTKPTPKPTQSKPHVKYEKVSKEMLAAIADGASAVAMKPVKGTAVKSDDLDDAYMIAMTFGAPGRVDITGVWTIESLKAGESLLMSIDGFAESFTNWPDAWKSQFAIGQSAHGVTESKDCLEKFLTLKMSPTLSLRIWWSSILKVYSGSCGKYSVAPAPRSCLGSARMNFHWA